MNQLTFNEEEDLLLSKVIDFLRFPLILGVVFIHNYTSTIVVQGVEIGNSGNTPVYYLVSVFFSQVLGRISVPLFFFISGYLFFYKVNFSRRIYCIKLKKRIWTLFVPYLFWNISFLIIYYMFSHLPILSSWFRGIEYDLNFIFSSMWGRLNEEGTMTTPIAYQFWFIRDLMVCVILAPFVYLIAKKNRCYGVALLGICWCLGCSLPYAGIRGLSTTAIFFFTFGAWYSINNKNVVSVFRSFKKWSFLYLPIAIVDLCTKVESYNPYIHNIGIVLGIVFSFTLVANLMEKGKLQPIPFLSSASFFVFAIHDPWLLSQIKKILFKLIQPENDIVMTMLYFGIVILVIIIALGIYYLLKCYFPRFTALITGGK